MYQQQNNIKATGVCKTVKNAFRKYFIVGLHISLLIICETSVSFYETTRRSNTEHTFILAALRT
jgi:hypothetical protein